MTTYAKLEGMNPKRTWLLMLGGVLSLGAVVIAAFAGASGETWLPVFAAGAMLFVVSLGLHARVLHRRFLPSLEIEVKNREQAEQRLNNTDRTMRSEIEARSLAQSELDQLFTSSLDLLCLAGFDGYSTRVNPAMCRAFGYTEEEMLSTPFADLIYEEDREYVKKNMARLATGETLTDIVVRMTAKGGGLRHTQWNVVPFLERGLIYTTGRDITEIKELEESLREVADKLNDAQRIGRVGSWEADLSTGWSEWSDEAMRIYGLQPGDVKPDADLFFSMVHPEDREHVRTMGGVKPRDGEYRSAQHRIVLKDGTERDVLSHMEFTCDADGEPVYIRGTCQDVTAAKEAERKNAMLEEQLRVSQKMDAIGALAGGVAHDFNNLMSVVLTYVGFAQEALIQGDPILEDLSEVQKAAERAAALTRQLLAFGRKQIFQPVPLDLNHVAEGIDRMLRRVVGERIELVQELAPDLGTTVADPGQLEQVLMNLVINARDAMPDGGKLTIETANIEVDAGIAAMQVEEPGSLMEPLHAGSYVMIAVTDTGCGMDEVTRSRLFEPFFTTKAVGKGTGLGLPTVYGIVKQSKGVIRVVSAPGEGSTFTIYLPREKNITELIRRKPTEVVPAVGDETVLVVEDEAAVRRSAMRILGDAGYEVLSASNGREALEVCEKHKGLIHLVLSDVVMPVMNGAELAGHLAQERPDTKILFMSGYSGDALADHGVLGEDTHLIGKPFNAVDLTNKVREVLDADLAVTAAPERRTP